MYTVLYVADGRIFSIGPFDSKEEADATARDAQNIVGEFDVRKQCVYLMYPDHRLVEYFPADFE